jgi:hypothetical protein
LCSKAEGVAIGHVSAPFPVGLFLVTLHALLFVKCHIAVGTFVQLLAALRVSALFAEQAQCPFYGIDGLIKVAITRRCRLLS